MRYYFIAILLLLSFFANSQAATVCITNEIYTIQYKNLEYKSRDYVSYFQDSMQVNISLASDYHQFLKDCYIEELRFMCLTKTHTDTSRPTLQFNIEIGDIFDIYFERGVNYYVFHSIEQEAYTILGYRNDFQTLVSIRTIVTGLKVGYECMCEIKNQ